MKIKNCFYKEIIEHCKIEYPKEACGILAGKYGKILKVYKMVNVSENPEICYFMKPEKQFKVFKEMRQLKMELLGIYHSHTVTDAYPSSRDMEMAFYPEADYVIVSLKDFNSPKVQAYKIIEGKIKEEKLILGDDKDLKEAKIHQQKYEGKKQEIIAKVKSAYYKLFLINKSIDIVSQHIELVRQLLKIAEIRYSTGYASQADVLKAQVSISSLLNKLIILRQKNETAKARLNILLNRDITSPLGKPKEPKIKKFNYTLEELKELTLKNRPSLLAARFAIEKSENMYKLAKKQYKPNFMVSLKQRQMNNKFAGWDAIVGINLPFVYKEKYDYKVKEIQDIINKNRSSYESMENMALLELIDTYEKITATQEQMEIYKNSIIPQAEQTLKASMKGYETGKVDFLTLIDNQRKLLNFELEYYKVLLNFEIYLAEMERVVGVEL